MEHKLLQGGGEIYLPFARSRIKALRAAGLRYASQKFVLPDAYVEVRIEPGQEYIRIYGGIEYETLSGAIKTGELVDLPIPPGSPDGTEPKKTLREFRPTVQTWQYPLKSNPDKSPDEYNDEPRLGVEAHADIGVSGSQYANICSSMYSGEMARVVQIALGVAPKGGKARQIHYDYRWAKCHGVFFQEFLIEDVEEPYVELRPWIFEISEENGVLAWPLPLLKGTRDGEPQNSKLNTSHQFADQYCITNYHGLPSGETFPTGAKLTQAITEGKVLQLLEPADLDPVYTKTTFSDAVGWSFNPGTSSTQLAQNCCWENVAGVKTAYRYQLEFDVDPNAMTGTATLTEVESVVLHGNSCFNFANTSGGYTQTPVGSWPGGAPANELNKAPIYVFYNGLTEDFEVVRHCAFTGPGSDTYNPGYYHPGGGTPDNPFTFAWNNFVSGATRVTYAESDSVQGFPAGYSYRREQVSISVWAVEPFSGYDYSYPYTEDRLTETDELGSVGCTLAGVRDGVALRQRAWGGVSSTTFVTYAYQNSGGFAIGWRDGGATNIYNSTSGPPTLPSPASGFVSGPDPTGEYDDLRIYTQQNGWQTLTPTYADRTEHVDNDALWRDATGILIARESVFGESQLVSSDNMREDTIVNCVGTLVDSESPSAESFAFIGYTSYDSPT